jgi:hypothetical protein
LLILLTFGLLAMTKRYEIFLMPGQRGQLEVVPMTRTFYTAHFHLTIFLGVLAFSPKQSLEFLVYEAFSMEPTTGLKPATCCLQNSRSIHLSYVGETRPVHRQCIRSYGMTRMNQQNLESIR